MGKLIKFGAEAREKIKIGVNLLSDAVSATMGPKGRNAVLGRPYGPPYITKDGVTVAKEIDLDDYFENLGAQLVKEVAHKTAEDAGDGTTTATVLAQAIYTEGLKLIAASHDPVSIKKGIDKATVEVVKYIQSISRPVSSKEEIIQIGTISANNEQSIGQIISEAMDKVGEDGIITVEEQVKGSDTTLEVVEGMQFDRGWVAPYFVTNADTMSADYKDVYILLHDGPISYMKTLVELMQAISQQGQGMGKQLPLLIIADSIEGEALAVLVTNKLRSTFPNVAVRAPYIGDRKLEFLYDIAGITGATVISQKTGRTLKEVSINDLGLCKSITVTKENTTIVGGQGKKEDIESRITQIKHELTQALDADIPFLKERLAKLTSGVAVINVGGNTDLEVQEKKDRIDDALNATRAAVIEGIVPGGGVALLRASNYVTVDCDEFEQLGVKVLLEAIRQPVQTIARNAGKSDSVVMDKIGNDPDTSVGYNAATDKYEDLVKAGVIDPTKVVRCALENAASVAGLMLTTEVTIVDNPETVKTNQDKG